MLDAGSALPFGADADHPYIQVSGLDHQHIGPNSIDLHLGGAMALLDHRHRRMNVHSPPGLIDLPVGSDGGWSLKPGELYLAHTREATACLGFVPRVDGRSSAGRMGISVHQTAGCGDNGFYGQWTLEITVVLPIWICPGARLLQVYFEPCTDEFGNYDLSNRYDHHGGHHYQGQSGVRGPSGLSTAGPLGGVVTPQPLCVPVGSYAETEAFWIRRAVSQLTPEAAVVMDALLEQGWTLTGPDRISPYPAAMVAPEASARPYIGIGTPCWGEQAAREVARAVRRSTTTVTLVISPEAFEIEWLAGEMSGAGESPARAERGGCGGTRD